MVDTHPTATGKFEAKRAETIRSASAENPMWEKLRESGYPTPSETILSLIPDLEGIRVRTQDETQNLRDQVMANVDEIFDMQRRGLLNGRAQTLVLAAMVFYSVPQYLAKSLSPDKRRQLEQLSSNLGIDLGHLRGSRLSKS